MSQLNISILILANAFGIISSCFYCYSQTKTTKKNKLKLHLVCNVADFVQYLLLVSISGAAASVIALLRNTSYVFVNNKKVRNTLVSIFCILEIVVIFIVHENSIIMFYVGLKITQAIITLFGKVKYLFYVELLIAVTWMFYDYSAQAYVASVLGIFSLVSITCGLIHNRGKLEGID